MVGVPAARHALRLLQAMARRPAPVAAAALARELDLPRSTTYHLLRELAAAGFVVHLAEERTWGLGVSAFDLGAAYERQAPLARLAHPVLARLVDELRHTAHLAVLHGREVLYLLEERAPGRPPLVTDVGVRLPAHLTASGRALLADLPAAHVSALFPDRSAFSRRHAGGPRSPTALRRLLVDVRRRGYAVEDGEVTPGYASVATAVHDHAGHPVAGVAVTYPTRDSAHESTREPADPAVLARAVKAAAAVLERRISGRPPTPGEQVLSAGSQARAPTLRP